MLIDGHDVKRPFERGVVVLSIDTEQIWGYLDRVNELEFHGQYPNALGAHEQLLACLRASGVSATWFMVGGLTLRESDGPRDRRMAGLPASWTAGIPSGRETTTPLWYRHSFVKRLREARPYQEVGLHGGLTHFIWTDPRPDTMAKPCMNNCVNAADVRLSSTAEGRDLTPRTTGPLDTMQSK